MENYSINRVELRGRIGQEPKIANVNGTRVIRFSLATSEIYKERGGDIKEETTWHNVTGWEGKNLNDFSVIQKGAMVTVLGKVRNVKYTTPDGDEHRFMEIVANSITPFAPASTGGR